VGSRCGAAFGRLRHIPEVVVAIALAVGTTKLDPTGTQVTSHATDSWTPTANRLLIACHFCSLSVFNAGDSCAGNGLTWTRSAEDHTIADQRFMVFTADSGSSPSTGATTITLNDSGNNWHFVIYEVTGGNLAAPITQISPTADDVGSGGTPTFTFGAASGADSAVIGQARRYNNQTDIVPPTGYTEDLEGNAFGTSRGMEICHHNGPGSVTTVTWGATNATWVAVGVEVNAGTDVVTPSSETPGIYRSTLWQGG
jgi:hypothetical protein